MDQTAHPRRLDKWEEIIGELQGVSTINDTRCLRINDNQILLDEGLEKDSEALVGYEVALLMTDVGPVLEVTNDSE